MKLCRCITFGWKMKPVQRRAMGEDLQSSAMQGHARHSLQLVKPMMEQMGKYAEDLLACKASH
jgi:hypothetical protein